MLSPKPDSFIGCESTYKDARAVLFGAPFDSTTSFRPGARFAPKAIRADSCGIETYSPCQDAELGESHVFDCGDLELPFGNAQRALNMIESHVERIMDDGKIPVMLGGEHLVTLGAVSAAAKKHADLNVIHFDAHTDLRDDYLGERLSHATVMRRVWDIVASGRIYQFGIRSGEKREFEFAARHTVLNAGLAAVEQTLARWQGKPLYITVDLDVLDPSVFPGTGTPEPGGASFAELHRALLALKGLDIVGCDVVELSPVYDQSGASTAVACKILRELLIMLGGK